MDFTASINSWLWTPRRALSSPYSSFGSVAGFSSKLTCSAKVTTTHLHPEGVAGLFILLWSLWTRHTIVFRIVIFDIMNLFFLFSLCMIKRDLKTEDTSWNNKPQWIPNIDVPERQGHDGLFHMWLIRFTLSGSGQHRIQQIHIQRYKKHPTEGNNSSSLQNYTLTPSCWIRLLD